MTCKYFMISNVCIIVNNSHHLDMNYLLTYYFIDSPLYQRRKCRHMYIYIYVSFFQDTHVSHWFPRPAKPLYLIKWRNHCTYAWSESTLFNIFSAKMQKCEIFCIFITIQFKWPTSIWCVFFHRSDSIFISDAMLQGFVGGGLGFFLCDRWTCLNNAFQPSVALSGSSVHNLAVFDFEPSFEWNK